MIAARGLARLIPRSGSGQATSLHLRTICYGAAWVVSSVFVLAGISKLAEPGSFHSRLSTWSLLPRSVLYSAELLVPHVELAVGFMWLLGVARRPAAMLMALLLATYTILFAAHLVYAEPPACGCLSLLRLHQESTSSAWWLLVRNAVMLSAVGLWLFGSAVAHESAVENQ
jgi:hypothetical protein